MSRIPSKEFLFSKSLLDLGKLAIQAHSHTRFIEQFYAIRDEKWIERVKEEYLALIKYVEINKQQDNDWFKIESDKEGKK